MKKLAMMVISGAIMTCINVQAQGQSPNVANSSQQSSPKKQKLSPEQRAQKSVDELDKIVGLSSDQKNKVYNLALERAKAVDAVFEKYKGQPDKKELAKQEVHEIRKKYRQGVKNILTPEQIEKLKQHHKANHSQSSKNSEDIIPDKD